MRWPWARRAVERRNAPYTDSIVSAIVAAAGGVAAADVHATAALEACAGIVGRAFAMAEPMPAMPALSPDRLALIGRDVMRRGESLHVIDVGADGRLSLLPVGSWDVQGGAAPASWWYRCDLFGPSGNETRLVPGSAVVHVRYSVDPARPWFGVGPVQVAALTGRLHAAVEQMAADEAGSARGYVLPLPAAGAGDGEGSDETEALRTGLPALRGKVAVVETTAGGFGEGRAAAPAADWVARRIGADVPAAMGDLRQASARAVMEACGVPPAVLGDGDSTARREALRVLLHTLVAPLGRLVANELTGKLERPIRLSFDALAAADVQGRARSVDSLVKAGVATDRALQLAGF